MSQQRDKTAYLAAHPWPALVLTALLGLPATVTAAEPDSRKLLHPASPGWLGAVGKLVVPASRISQGRRQHFQEDCSATLVAPPNSAQADIIVTAWHCLEFYRDLSKPIVFTLRYGQADAHAHQARRLADGGGMHADWAILRLQAPVAASDVAGVPISPGEAALGSPLTMAGFSRDPGLGGLGERLTYDEDCQITARRARVAETDCQAHKGSSGGAVVAGSSGGGYRLLGVISEGDGRALSTFVPAASFRGSLNRYLTN